MSALLEACVAAGWAAATSAIVTGVARRLALRAGALDLPSDRKIHTTPTARVGGVGILVGVLPWLLRMPGDALLPALLLGSVASFAVGFADDGILRGKSLSARVKLALQLGAAALAVGIGGLRFEGRGSGPFGDVDLGALAAPMTVLWCFAVLTVVNFLDGIDGISSATCLVVLATAAGAGSWETAPVYAAAVGSILGFAVWNAPPARIFMGDGGSHLLGFLVASTACTTIPAPGGTGVAGPPPAPWALVAAPLVPAILDVGEALIHKLRRGIALSRAHDDHLYQRLVKAGDDPFTVTMRYAGLSVLAVVVAGPVARLYGLAVAVPVSVLILLLHGVTGLRRTRGVPRLAPDAHRPS